jgi:hypothetical protein
MIFINKNLNTKPLICHAQGEEHDTKRWKQLCNNDLKVNKLPENMTIVTFLFGKKTFSLKNQLDNNKIEYKNFIDTKAGYWMNRFKIKYICDYIDQIDTDYILCLDGIDTLLSEDLSTIVNKFLRFDTDILYNASIINYPELEYTEKTNSNFKYLNAGAFIGKTDSIKEFYKYIYDNFYETDDVGSVKSEQHRVRLARQNYKGKVKTRVDTGCVIFQTLSQTDYSVIDNSLIIN